MIQKKYIYFGNCKGHFLNYFRGAFNRNGAEILSHRVRLGSLHNFSYYIFF